METPTIKYINSKKALFVDGKPFFMISGEIHNSNSSTYKAIEETFSILEKLNLNSALAPISWQMIEKEEGVFDFSIVDTLIDLAKKHHLKLGVLYFGAYKNGAMSYVPDYVKLDIDRFKRAELVKGKNMIIRKSLVLDMPYTTLSPFCKETLEADSRAFNNLLSYIKEKDIDKTIITIQVENEPGFLGGDFDYSDDSLKEYKKEVPEEFINFLKEHKEKLHKKLKIDFNKKGTWEQLFKRNAHEVFIAFYISKYIGTIASRGKEIYPLPYGVNCWLRNKKQKAGKYPCGGPIDEMMEVYMYNCKDIDYYCPDNYLYEFYDILDKFDKHGNPIYVPESKLCSKVVERQLTILGHYNGMCFAAFGIEDIVKQSKIDLSRFAWMLGFSVDSHKSYPQDIDLYAKVNKLLNGSYFEFMKHYGTNDIECFNNEKKQKKYVKDFGNIRFKTTMVPFIRIKDKAT